MDAKKPRTRPNLNLPPVEGAGARRSDPERWQSEPQHVFKPGEYCTDRYAILRLVAAGGMSEVYECYDRQTSEYRALKVLQLKHRHNRPLAKRAESEAKTLLEIRHPNLVRVVDAGLADGQIIFFVMELLQGCTLRELLEVHGPLPLPLAIDLVLQLAAGVHALHTIGVFHRDLKPENAFVVRPEPGSSALLLKLLDLGAARFEHRHHVTTSINHTLGTLQYMSPEQSSGETKVDARTDVYALAIILFELTAGIHPARLLAQPPLTNGEWTGWHIHADKPDLDVKLKDAPSALVRLVRASLHKDPSRRIPDALTFANALRGIRQQLSGPANDVSSLVWHATGENARSEAHQLRLVLTSDVSPRVPFASTSETPLKPQPAAAAAALLARDTIQMADAPAATPPSDGRDPARDDAEALAILALEDKPTLRMDPGELGAGASPMLRNVPSAAQSKPPGGRVAAPSRERSSPRPSSPRPSSTRPGPARVVLAEPAESRPGREPAPSTITTLARAVVAGLAIAIVLLGLGVVGSRLVASDSGAVTSASARVEPPQPPASSSGPGVVPAPALANSAAVPPMQPTATASEATAAPPARLSVSATAAPRASSSAPPRAASPPQRSPPASPKDIWERDF